MAAMPKSAPAQPHAGAALAPAVASGTALNRTASLTGLSSPSAVFAELQQSAPQTLGTPATPAGQSRFPWSLRASRYGPSQVVPAPLEEGQPSDSRRSMPAAQQRQQSAQLSASPAKLILPRVAAVGNRRLLAEQQRRSVAGAAAHQQGPKAAPLRASACAVPSRPWLEDAERSGSPTEAGMAAATGSEGGDGPSSAYPTRRGDR